MGQHLNYQHSFWDVIQEVTSLAALGGGGGGSRGSKILATRGRRDFVKFYLAPPPQKKMRVAPQMPPPQIPRPGAATD